MFTLKTSLEFLGSSFITATSLFDILIFLELLPFQELQVSAESMSVHFSWVASQHLIPVLAIGSCHAFVVSPMSWSASFSVGIKGSFRVLWQIGGSHFRPCI